MTDHTPIPTVLPDARALLEAMQKDRSTNAGRAAFRMLNRINGNTPPSTYTEREDWFAILAATQPASGTAVPAGPTQRQVIGAIHSALPRARWSCSDDESGTTLTLARQRKWCVDAVKALYAAAPKIASEVSSRCPTCGDTSPLDECPDCGAYPTRKVASDTGAGLVTIPRMTEAEARGLWYRSDDGSEPVMTANIAVAMLRHLGIVASDVDLATDATDGSTGGGEDS